MARITFLFLAPGLRTKGYRRSETPTSAGAARLAASGFDRPI
ncbi:MAG: hypothetical protein ACKO3W_09955 [bacterium]